MLKIITGDSAGFTFSIVYAGMVADIAAPDLSACTVKFMVKASLADSDYKAVFVQEIVNPDTNIVHFQLNPSDTAKLKQGTYKAACKLFYDSGTELTVWQGDIIVAAGVFNG
ncbi:MAG: hypothetical protein IKA01_09960 [Alistipes sp.]|nr:hypothetical protein [Alistipes sp.]